MSDTETTESSPPPTDPTALKLERIANSLEQISRQLAQLLDLALARPQVMAEPALDAGVPTDMTVGISTMSTDSNTAFISGRWKRRQGDVIHAPAPGQQRGAAAPYGPLDPWVKPVPPPRTEEPYGEKAEPAERE